MKFDGEKYYLRKDLQKALKDAGIPHSYPTFMKYEKEGRIPRPRQMIVGVGRPWRIYTKGEIREIVRALSRE